MTTQPEQWEEQLSDLFDGLWLDGSIDYNTQETFDTLQTQVRIKDFVSQLLKTQHKQTLKMVRKILLNNVISIQDHGTFVKIDPLMDFLEQEI